MKHGQADEGAAEGCGGGRQHSFNVNSMPCVMAHMPSKTRINEKEP